LTQRGVIKAADLVTHRFGLTEINEDLKQAQKPEALKVIITFNPNVV
jgi:threonine dehydrogenase-like Zn-dependent dehydrogenase